MPWKRHRYRENKVWVHVDASEAQILDERGLAEVRYKPEDERAYTVRPSDLSPVEPPEALRPDPPPPPIQLVVCLAPARDEPPPAGRYAYGAALKWRDHRRTLEGWVAGANRVEAGAQALLASLRQVKRPELGVEVQVAEGVAEAASPPADAASPEGQAEAAPPSEDEPSTPKEAPIPLPDPIATALVKARGHFASLEIRAYGPRQARARAAAQDRADRLWREG